MMISSKGRYALRVMIDLGTLAPVTCLERGQQCENAKNCRTLPLWQGLDRTIADYLGRYTLADLARMEKEP